MLFRSGFDPSPGELGQVGCRAPRADDDRRTRFEETSTDAGTDAAGTPGDQHHLAAEVERPFELRALHGECVKKCYVIYADCNSIINSCVGREYFDGG